MQDLAPDSIVAIKDLSFSYGSAAGEVLSGVDLVVNRGEYVGIIGPNGGGKTTLLKLMLGLLKPEHGAISLFGTDSRKFRDWYRVGYVSQSAVKFDSLFPATVLEVAAMGRYARRGLFRSITDEDRDKARAALKQVGMEAFADRRISDLSGGQKQRVFIARALASEPEVVMLDEPTTGVDQETQEHFYKLLTELNRKHGLTLVLVSHDLERIAREATCIAFVEKELRYYRDPQEALRVEHPSGDHH